MYKKIVYFLGLAFSKLIQINLLNIKNNNPMLFCTFI